MSVQKITPYLWYNGDAEEAAAFYVSLFDNSKIVNVHRAGPDGPAFMVTFQLAGQQFYALNGGPKYSFTPAMSLYVNCETQEEVDRLWDRFLDGGTADMCGWLRDRYGVSWQIIPSLLGTLMGDKDPAKAGRVMQAMLQMQKIDSAGLQAAYDQG